MNQETGNCANYEYPGQLQLVTKVWHIVQHLKSGTPIKMNVLVIGNVSVNNNNLFNTCSCYECMHNNNFIIIIIMVAIIDQSILLLSSSLLFIGMNSFAVEICTATWCESERWRNLLRRTLLINNCSKLIFLSVMLFITTLSTKLHKNILLYKLLWLL